MGAKYDFAASDSAKSEPRGLKCISASLKCGILVHAGKSLMIAAECPFISDPIYQRSLNLSGN